ncbi:uncharacterized protein LOC111247936 isoform X1 [Varroa destructor]|uniref:MARVEL domain-containing protein n=1 Tax=Varroa destructor TaxID=109461 RepID=A0A7M7K3Y0_VARDE|nr:uncharacterized protein LOC111247936 isoform X1 [Varroa destructor]
MQTRSQVTTTTTVTGTTSNGYLSLNTGYLRTINGWLKVAQIGTGLIVLLLLVFWKYTCSVSWGHFLQLTSFCFFTITALMLFSCVASLSGMTLLTTLFYLNYHILGFTYYLCGALAVVIQAPSNQDAGLGIAAGVLGLLNASFYGIDALFAFKGRLN